MSGTLPMDEADDEVPEEHPVGLERLGPRLKTIIERRTSKSVRRGNCPALKRLRTDLASFTASEQIRVQNANDGLWCVKVLITPEEGYYCSSMGRAGAYSFLVTINEEYPYEPPSVTCESNVFHPNVHPKTGVVSIPHLVEDWTPVMSLSSVFNLLLELMEFPGQEPEYVLNKEAAALLQFDSTTFMARVLDAAQTLSNHELLLQNEVNSTYSSSSCRKRLGSDQFEMCNYKK